MIQKMKNIKSIISHYKDAFHYRLVFAPGMAKLYRCYQNIQMHRIRKKKQIKVLFIIAEASTWKTELLYQAMLSHPRFIPVLGVTESMHVPGSKQILIKYLSEKGYSYVDLDDGKHSIAKINPDIKFYYKPYELNYRHGLYFDFNLKSVVCTIYYSFNLGGDSLAYRHEIREYSWKEFVENQCVVDTIEGIGKYSGNKLITGLPLQDILSLPKETYSDPWMDNSGKKRIIYAPHHSFKCTNCGYIEYATFLDFGEFILSLAKKYSNQTEWIFKPHPSLKIKLYSAWGKDKTDKYYSEWENLPNSQVKLGAYNDIFSYSDAMIHDCSSFIIEYLYTDNPILFLEYEHKTAEQLHLSQFGYDAYSVHYHASNEKQIEDFILNVIGDVDTMKNERSKYFDKYLTIPNKKSACENIIDAILRQTNNNF